MPALGVAKTIGASTPSAHHRSNRGWQSTRLCRLPPPPISTMQRGSGPETSGAITAYGTGSGKLADDNSDSSMFDGIGDTIGIVRNDNRAVAERRSNLDASRRLQLAGVIAVNIIGVFQHVAGEYRDHVGI